MSSQLCGECQDIYSERSEHARCAMCWEFICGECMECMSQWSNESGGKDYLCTKCANDEIDSNGYREIVGFLLAKLDELSPGGKGQWRTAKDVRDHLRDIGKLPKRPSGPWNERKQDITTGANTSAYKPLRLVRVHKPGNDIQWFRVELHFDDGGPPLGYSCTDMAEYERVLYCIGASVLSFDCPGAFVLESLPPKGYVVLKLSNGRQFISSMGQKQFEAFQKRLTVPLS